MEFSKTIDSVQPSKVILEERLARLNEVYNAFCLNQDQLEETCGSLEVLEGQILERSQAETYYYYCIGEIKEALLQLCIAPQTGTAPGGSCSSAQLIPANSQDIRLPRIPLPTFTGIYEEWPSFQDLFVSLIHNNATLDPVRKLHYLKAHLSGEPLELIRSMQVTDANYPEAWRTIKERYDNKRFIVDRHHQTLLNQPLITHEDPSALKKLLDTSVESTRALTTLGIPVNH